MTVLFSLLSIILFLIITKTQFFNEKYSSNKFMTQFGMAILVGVVTTNIFFINTSAVAFKYTAFGIGIMSFIAIITEMVIFKKKQHIS